MAQSRIQSHREHWALQITATYAALAGLWIAGSDYVVDLLVGYPTYLTLLHTFKDTVVFVGITSLLLYSLIRHSDRIKQRSRVMFDATKDALLMMDAQGRFLDANVAALTLTGYTRNELLGLSIPDLTPPEDRDDLPARLQRVLQDNTPFRLIERSLMTKDGQRVPVEVAVGPLALEGVPAFLAVVRNISERKRSEAALRQSEARFRHLFEASPLGVTIARGGINLFVNAAYLRIFGYHHPGEVCGRPLIDHIAPQYRTLIADRNRRREAGEAVISSYEMVGLRKDGSEFPFHADVTWIELPDGPASVAFIADITARKAAEEQIRRQTLRAQVLVELSRTLAELHLDHQAVLTSVSRRVAEVLGDGCSIRQLADDGQSLAAGMTYHADREICAFLQQLLAESLAPAGEGLNGLVLRTGQPYVTADLAAAARAQSTSQYLPYIERYGAHAAAIVPLQVHGRIIGTLAVTRDRTPGSYTDDDLVFIQEIADRAALAIENTRLFYAAQSELIERRHTEQALRASEQQYRLLFDYNPQPMWVYDAETLRFLAVNDAAVAHYGYSRAEFLEMSLQDIRPHEEIPALLAANQIKGPALRHAGLFRHHKRDGTLIEVEITRYALPFAGRPAKLVLINDVTERRRAEATLIESEANLRAIFDNAHESISLLAPDYTILAFNAYAQAGARAVFGREMRIGQSMLDFVAPHDLAGFKEHFAAALGGVVQTIEKQFFGVHGEDWWEFFYTPIKLPDGSVKGVAFIARNTAERKRAEQALRESDIKLRMIASQMPTIVWTVDHDLRITWAMGTGLSALGYTSDQITGRTLYEYHRTNDPAQASIAAHRAALAGQSGSYELKTRGRTLDVRVEPLRNAQEQIVGCIAVAVDITEREAAAARLRETEAREQAILNGTHDPIFLKDRAGRYLLANPACARAIGCTTEELLGKTDAEILGRELTESFTASDQQVLATGRPLEIETTLEIDGVPHTFLTLKSPYRDGSGEVHGVIGMARDITDRTLAEQALRRSEATNRALLAAVPDLMFRFSRAGVFLDYHLPKDGMLLAPPETFLGRRIDEVMPPEFARQAYEHIERTFETGEVQIFEYQLTIDERLAEFEARFSVCGEDELLMIRRDITERKRMERALRDARDVYLTLVEEVPMLVWRANLQGRTDFVNKRWVEYTGRGVESHPAAHFEELIHPDDQPACRERMRTAWQEQRPFVIECRMRRKDGSYRWIESHGSPFYDDQGAFAGYIGTGSDIHERKRQEQIKDDFLALASHELKTPLAALLGYVHLLERWSAQHSFGERIDRSLSAMIGEGMRLDRLINDLLDVSRIQTGKLRIFMQPTDLSEVVRRSIDNLRLVLPDNPLLLELSLHAPVLINADAQRIEQAITNLCTNAAKYSPPHAPVMVRLRGAPDQIELSVQDCGLGIPAADLPHIFERFYQVQRPTRESRPGLGLGLFITHEIIRLHGGQIKVESVEYGGSVFTILLPLS